MCVVKHAAVHTAATSQVHFHTKSFCIKDVETSHIGIKNVATWSLIADVNVAVFAGAWRFPPHRAVFWRWGLSRFKVSPDIVILLLTEVPFSSFLSLKSSFAHKDMPLTLNPAPELATKYGSISAG